MEHAGIGHLINGPFIYELALSVNPSTLSHPVISNKAAYLLETHALELWCVCTS